MTESHKKILVEFYKASPKNRDDLPYTRDFNRLYAEFLIRTGRPYTKHQVWKALAGLGKAGRLIRKARC